MRIISIQGIGSAHAAKLTKVGIRTTDELLQKAATPDGRKEIAESSGIGPELILRWVRMADLYRIEGLGSQYLELLEGAGVNTVLGLSKSVAQDLHGKMLAVHQAKSQVNGIPGLKQVKRWIDQARKLRGWSLTRRRWYGEYYGAA
jgi:predicted flap endonuclease-1-like 5' DNA nuclease